MNKNEEKCLPDEKIANKDDGLCIERDRIITTSFEIMISNDDNKEKKTKTVEMKYRVLSVYKKQSNKWFMTSEKQMWNASMKEEDLKKFRCSVRLLVDEVFEQYKDVLLISNEWPRNHICKVISGLEIVNVLDQMFNY